MNNLLSSELQEKPPAEERERTVLDLLIVLARHKKLMIGLPLLAGVCAALITTTLPNIYMASAQILPPQQSQSTATAMLNQLSGLAGAAGSAFGLKNPNDLYAGMLSSRTVADRLVQRFDLKKHYEQSALEKTRQMLERNTFIKVGKNGLISINVEDRDPKVAAMLANAYVEELGKLLGSLVVTEASQRRLFFERQLRQSENELAQAEAALKSGLDARGVISVDGQSKAMVETVAHLRAQIVAKEIELSAMQAFVTEHNVNYKRRAQELAGMRSELNKLENGTHSGAGADGKPEKQPGLGNIKLLREVKYQQMLYELLSRQYEAARLDEAKESPVIQVLDKAVEPENKSKPKRTMIVLSAALMGLLVAVFWSVLSEWMRANRQPDTQDKLDELKSLLGFRKSA